MCISVVSFKTLNLFSIAIEKLIQARGETSPVLTSFDPVHSPTAKDPPDQVSSNALSYSPIHSATNSATSTPSSSTKRSSRRRTMLFSSSVCITVSLTFHYTVSCVQSFPWFKFYQTSLIFILLCFKIGMVNMRQRKIQEPRREGVLFCWG